MLPRESSTDKHSTRCQRIHTKALNELTWFPTCRLRILYLLKIGKDFMLSHGYIKNDFDVHEWAAPEFLEQAARELLEAEWKKDRSTAKLPSTAAGSQAGDSGWKNRIVKE